MFARVKAKGAGGGGREGKIVREKKRENGRQADQLATGTLHTETETATAGARKKKLTQCVNDCVHNARVCTCVGGCELTPQERRVP